MSKTYASPFDTPGKLDQKIIATPTHIIANSVPRSQCIGTKAAKAGTSLALTASWKCYGTGGFRQTAPPYSGTNSKDRRERRWPR
jgi:hypothetical protein